jgi:adenylate cyclase
LARVRAMLRLKEMHDTLEEWNRSLADKVNQQVKELERLARLKRYLSPQIAETILDQDDDLFKTHRREITIVFLDLRGFTAFSDSAEPEEVMDFLRPDHAQKAAMMALEMRDRVKELRAAWLKKGYDLDLGVGFATGYATLGTMGFEGRMDYGTVGNLPNLAARLCAEAKGGQILTDQKTMSRLENSCAAESIQELSLKGISRPILAFNVTGAK